MSRQVTFVWALVWLHNGVVCGFVAAPALAVSWTTPVSNKVSVLDVLSYPTLRQNPVEIALAATRKLDSPGLGNELLLNETTTEPFWIIHEDFGGWALQAIAQMAHRTVEPSALAALGRPPVSHVF